MQKDVVWRGRWEKGSEPVTGTAEPTAAWLEEGRERKLGRVS